MQEHFPCDADKEEEATGERVEERDQRQSHEPEGTQEFETNDVNMDKDAEDDVVYVGMNPVGDARGATAEETQTANAELYRSTEMREGHMVERDGWAMFEKAKYHIMQHHHIPCSNCKGILCQVPSPTE